MEETQTRKRYEDGLELIRVDREQDLPQWIDRARLAAWLHESLKPFEDTMPDIEGGLDYAFSDAEGLGGFVVLAHEEQEIVGALVMLSTGMSGYIPENILLFVAVSPEMRGRGVGRRVIEWSIEQADGDVKLHVEHDNPAKRLYERIGFTQKYAEMRFNK